MSLTRILLFPFNKIGNEARVFNTYPREMRILLLTNMIYAFVLPVIDIFVGAYIMRNSANPSMVAFYQLTVYTGIPFTFLINGFLLNRVKIAHLYSFGMLLSGVSLLAMMMLQQISFAGVGIAGFLMGSSFGFFWANRDFLALNTTTDDTRNYYYGVETFFYTLTYIIVPFFIGLFIARTETANWFGGDANNAYKLVTGLVFLLTIVSTIVVQQGRFKNPTQKKFIFWKFDKLWYQMLFLASLKGIGQGYLVTAPAILIMTLVGNESELGTIQSICGIITALVLYVLGRVSKPQHRIYIFSIGLIIFAVGAITNSILFSATGVIIFMLCKILFQPLHDLAYFPIQLKVIDHLAKKEGRNEFAYIFNHEFGLYVGRAFGLVLFIVLHKYISEVFALKYALLIIALIQLVAIPVAKRISR
jgi:MFS transporter, YQGE family, putative transporter